LIGDKVVEKVVDDDFVVNDHFVFSFCPHCCPVSFLVSVFFASLLPKVWRTRHPRTRNLGAYEYPKVIIMR
jgi:hypothetical protein